MSFAAVVAALPTPADSSPSASSTADLFVRAAAGDLAARDALIAEHLPLVKHMAGRMARRLTVRVEYDELLSAGTLGLIQAVESFDAARGRAFSTFAAPRIRGAILDELRRHDHVSRGLRRKVRALAAAEQALTRQLGRTPDDREIAAHLAVPVETLWRWQRERESATHRSIAAPPDRAPTGPGQATSVLAELALPEEAAPDAHLDRAETLALLREAILALTEQERVVLGLYYFEELPMKAIAPVLEVTESRICQIHKKALRSLRTAVATRIERAA